MNFIDDTSWITDPSITISTVSTGSTNNYAFNINGALNAGSISLNGVDINSIYAKNTDLISNSNLEFNYLNIKCNLNISNTLTQTGKGDINLIGDLYTSGNITINSNKLLLVNGNIRSTSNIFIDNFLYSSNASINSLNITSNIILNNSNTSLIFSNNNRTFKLSYDNNSNFLIGEQMIFNNNGNISLLSNNNSNYTFINSLRIAGWDSNNTIFNSNSLTISSSNTISLNTNNYNGIFINNYGDVGIGTTIINNSNSLSVYGNIDSTSYSINGISIDFDNYINSNIFYQSIYTNNIKYPSRSYTNIPTTTTTTFLNKNVFSEVITISSTGETYIIYSSSVFNNNSIDVNPKRFLFNGNITTDFGCWGSGNYRRSDGNYIGNNFIVNDFFGDWIIIKLARPIILTSFKFYAYFLNLHNAPSSFRCYGSKDGIFYSDIMGGTYNINSYNPSTNSIEINVFNQTTFYMYIGFVFNKIQANNINATFLCLSEIELFGKEILSVRDNYISSNVLINNILPRYSTIGNDTNYLKVINGNIINSNLIVNSNTTLNSNLTVSGTSILSGDVTARNNLIVNSNTTLNSNLTVSGTSILSGDVTARNNLIVNSNTTLNSNLTVSGTSILTGDVTARNNLIVNSNTTLNSNLTVSGTSILSGDVTARNNLIVNSNTTLNSNLTVSGTSILSGDVTARNNLIVNSNTTLNSNLTVSGTSILIGDVTARNNLIVNSNTTLNSNLSVLGTSTLTGTVIAQSNLTVNSNLFANTIYEEGTVLSNKYLLKSGGVLTGTYFFTNVLNNPINISGGYAISDNMIRFANNINAVSRIGFGGSSYTSLNSSYSNNFYIHCDCNIILNAGRNTNSSNPHLFISTTGNIGIGTSTNLNSNLTINGSLSVSNINATNIRQNNIDLNTLFINTSNYSCNLINNLGLQFPPKLYNSVTTETTTQFLGKIVFYQSFIINPYQNGYGIGEYKLYSSTSFGTGQSKNLLFNYIDNENSGSTTHWATNQYTSVGIYNSTNFIVNNYLGDWIIIKFPIPLILTKFQFYNRPTIQYRAPGEWRCYGSFDGVIWNEISSASQTIRLSTTNYSLGYYEKILSSLPPAYLYIGWTINKLAGSDSILNFSEIKIFGNTEKYLSLDTSNQQNISFINGSLRIYERAGNTGTSASGSLVIEHGDINGSSSIVFPSIKNIGTDHAYIKYIENVGSGASAGVAQYNYFGSTSEEIGALILGCENDDTGSRGPDSVIINPAGSIALVPRNNITYISSNVGIGITNPSTSDLLTLKTSTTTSDTNINFINNLNSNAIIGVGGSSTTSLNTSYSNNFFIHSTCNIILNAGSNINSNNPHLFISSSGNIGIGTNNPNSGVSLDINGHLYVRNKIFIQEIQPINDGNKSLSIRSRNGGNLSLYAETTGNIYMHTNNINRLQINSSGDVIILSNLTVNSKLFANIIYEGGTVLSNKYLLASGGIISGNINITSNLTIGSDLNVNSNTTLNSNLTVSGTSTLSGDVIAQNNLTVNSNLFANIIYEGGTVLSNKYLLASGGSISGNINITSNLTIGSDLTVNSNTTLNSNLTVSGTSTLTGDVTVRNNLTINSNLNVLSNIYLTSNLFVSGNIGINTTDLTSYKLNVGGTLNATKISSNGVLIDFSSYVTSNQLYGLAEKQYPPRIYDTYSNTNSTILGNNSYSTEILYINNGDYGAGTYTIYSSTINLIQDKKNLFNYVINDNYNGNWGSNYNSSTGFYNNSTTPTFINNNYNGDWIIIKLPSSIVLSRFRFYKYSTNIINNPALWRCYGSIDGINFILINEANNDINSLSSSDYDKGYYEKLIPNTFTTSYLYIGFVFNKIIGGSGNLANIPLTFVELQLYSRDQTPSALFVNNLINNNLLYYSTTGNDPNYLKISSSGTIDSSAIFTNNITLSGITKFNSNVGINTTDLNSYNLNVNGSLNANNIYENGSLLSNKYLGISSTALLSSNLTGNPIINVSNITSTGTIAGTIITASGNLQEGALALSNKYLGINSTALLSSNLTGNPNINVNNIISTGTISGVGTNISQLNANNISSGTLIAARGGSKWTYYNSSNIYYTANGGNVMTNSIICNYGISNLIPNSTYKSYIMLSHNTHNGSIGANFPNPECAILMTNSSSSKNLPWGFYSGVVKYFASTNPNISLRYDIGTCTINNTVETQTGTNTFTPFLSMLWSGSIGIGTTTPGKSRLHIYETNGTDSSSNTGSLIIQHGNSNGISSITFPSVSGSASGDYAYIKYAENVVSTSFNYFGGSGIETGALILGCENDNSTSGPDSIIINPSGNIALVPINGITYISSNVGIGITNPSTSDLLTLKTSNSNIDADINFINNLNSNATIGVGGSSTTSLNSSYSNNFFIHAQCNIIFNANNNNNSNNPHLFISSIGNIGIGTSTNLTSNLNINGSLNVSNITSTGTIAGTIITASGNLQEGILLLSNKYLGISSTALLASNLTDNPNINVNNITSTGSISGIGSNITLLNYNNIYNFPSGLISSNSASNIFLTQSLATSLYLTQTNANNTYLNINSNSLGASNLVANPNINVSSITSLGTITGTTINASTNLQETGININTKYLGISSNALLSSNLTGNPNINVGTINASGIFTGGIHNLSSSINDIVSLSNSTSNLYANIRFNNNSNSNAIIGIGGTAYTGYYRNNLFIQAQSNIILNANNTSNVNPHLLISTSGNIGIGTTISNGSLEIYSQRQLQPSLILSGIEFFNPLTQGIINGGIALIAGVNRTLNRQLWVADSANLTVNNSTPVLRLTPGRIDCIATDGSTNMPLSVGSSMIILANGNVGIGLTNPGSRLDISGNINASGSLTLRGNLNSEFLYIVDNTSYGSNQFGLMINSPTSTSGASIQTIQQGIGYSQRLLLQKDSGNVCIGTTTATSGNTKLTISGSSTGYSQPLVQITQNAAWDGNYALQISGYTNLGGFRINGADTGNSIYQSLLNTDLGISQNPGNSTGGNISFTTYGDAASIRFFTHQINERMRINSSGNVGIGTTNPNAFLHIHNNNDNWQTSVVISGNNNTNKYGLNVGGSTNSEIGTAGMGIFDGNSTINRYVMVFKNGNIGIGTTNPNSRLHIYETTGTDASTNAGSLIIQHQNSGGVSSITFPSVSGSATGDYAYIKYAENVVSTSYNYFGGSGSETGALIIGCENDNSLSGPDSVIINPSGNIALVPKNGITYISSNVGIGITNPSTTDLLTLKISNSNIDTDINFINNLNSNASIGIGGSASSSLNSSYQNNFFIHAQCNIILNANSNSISSNPNLFISTTGNIGIGTTNPLQLLDINGSLLLRTVKTGIIGLSGLFFREGSLYNCSIVTFDHYGGGIPEGLSINGYNGISFCTGGSTFRGEKIRITQNGNIGIGITNPSTNDLLTLKISNSNIDADINFINNLNSNASIGIGGSASSSLNSSYSNNFFIHSKTNIIINANSNSISSNPHLFISTSGNIGIGTSTNLNSNLNINGSLSASNITLSGTLNVPSIINPNIIKKNGISFTCTTATTINSITYYKYDINLTSYTKTLNNSSSTPYRIFRMKIFNNNLYFQNFTNNLPNVLNYEIYMSSNASTGPNGEQSGINICAIGTPENYYLSNILPTRNTLMRTNNFDYLSVISISSNISYQAIIEDLLN